MKTKDSYLATLSPNQLVAFQNNGKMISAKIISVGDKVEVETKNGSRYLITKDSISWVKTGSRWPVGIYNALKSRRGDMENETEHSDFAE